MTQKLVCIYERFRVVADKVMEAMRLLMSYRSERDKPGLRQFADVLFLYFAGILTPKHYFDYELYRSDAPGLLNLPYLGRRAWLQMGETLNPACWRHVVQNKWLFSLYVTELELPHPKVYGYFDVHCGTDYLGRPLRTRSDLFDLLESECISELVVKPLCGGQGRDVMVLSRNEKGAFMRGNGSRLTMEELVETMSAEPFLLQARVEQDRAMSQLGGTALNTYRIVTFVDKQGQAHIHHAALRLGHGMTDVDNFSQGGLYVHMDHSCGLLDRATVKYTSDLVDTHPDTGMKFPDYAAPHWDAVSALALRAASLFPLGSLGWDIAVSTEGPVIIEANHGWIFLRLYRGYLQPEVRRQLAEYGIRQR